MKKRYKVDGMHCVGCTIAVEGAIEDVKGVKSASANYAKQIAEVEFDETRVTDAQIAAAVELAGYTMVGALD
jgi:copper chaperone CopZ